MSGLDLVFAPTIWAPSASTPPNATRVPRAGQTSVWDQLQLSGNYRKHQATPGGGLACSETTDPPSFQGSCCGDSCCNQACEACCAGQLSGGQGGRTEVQSRCSGASCCDAAAQFGPNECCGQSHEGNCCRESNACSQPGEACCVDSDSCSNESDPCCQPSGSRCDDNGSCCQQEVTRGQQDDDGCDEGGAPQLTQDAEDADDAQDAESSADDVRVAPQSATPATLGNRTSEPVEVSDASFRQEVLESNKPVLVVAYAPWCGACRSELPQLQEFAAVHGTQTKVARLNVDENAATANRFHIEALPTLMLFKDGKRVDQQVGAASLEELESRYVS